MKNRSFPRILEVACRSRFPRVLAITAVALALAACSSKADSDAQPASAMSRNVTMTAAQRQHIQLATVAESAFHQTVETTGVVDFDNDQATSVLAPFSGPVSRLLVSVGEPVKKGQALALVDSPDFAAAVGAYRKALSAAVTARRLADLDKDMLQHQGVSQREEAQAQSDATGAESDRDAALQALLALNVDPGTIKAIQQGRPVTHADGVIRSPITGTLVEKMITPGQLLQAGSTPCFTVADLSQVWVMAQLFGIDIAAVAPGDAAQVMTDADSTHLAGKVAHVAAVVDPGTGAVAARVVVANPGDVLKKQMYVRVLIQSQHEQHGLLVPVSAVLRDDDNLPFVYVAEHDDSFARRHVTLGNRIDDRYDIAAGLRPGDQIVVEGGIFVHFMQTQ
ncbi:MAG: efflux RND transporter periplasmic adaptor subunit [Stenotrophobium sp.]